ncbi:putative beta-lactamase-like 1 [Trichosurus vulpecula]|uniref:putative beta-lactamase-like 1 n=1 Tax=Trichosurus vulpecula TaxID=9337 RepID=UPI00186AFA1C|nr:putative beta-lactamase-like 1 [Trichosurus vulpecula]
MAGLKPQVCPGLTLPTVKGRWAPALAGFFFLLSVAMTGCFLWQYHLRKAELGSSVMEVTSETVRMCPRYPEPVPLEHPLPVLKEALEKVDKILRQTMPTSPGLTAMSAVVIYNDTVLWTGNFGWRNGSDRASGPPTEYTIYRIASISKIFPTLMLYRLWEEGIVASLDDPLERYAQGFRIKNPLGAGARPVWGSLMDGLDKGAPPLKPTTVTLRRMASQLSGLPRRLRSTTLLWRGSTEDALALLKDDILVADPGTRGFHSRCHYSTLAFSLLAHVLARHTDTRDYQQWVSENILDRLGMEDTGFDLAPWVQARMAAGFYGSGHPAPLYDLGWYRPSGQMYSTPADLAKLAMVLLGSAPQSVLAPDTLKTMLTPLLTCPGSYFANQTGTPWEFHAQRGYSIVRKDGDLDGYAATFSLVPQLKLSFIVLMAGPRPPGLDLVTQVYDVLIPAMEIAFREVEGSLAPPPSPGPYLGFYTYANLTFYEILLGPSGVLCMRQFGPQVEKLIPAKFRTLKLHHLQGRVFQVVVDKEFPCVLPLGAAWLPLETQHGQLLNFYPFDQRGLSPGFDAPGLNTYKVLRMAQKPVFNTLV